jgi:UDP-N-acetylmuramyl pentapeptide phosphotransferase/UDP-N-acetylglucosamine-1-phosphate transferase
MLSYRLPKLRRAASCTAFHTRRYDLQYLELSVVQRTLIYCQLSAYLSALLTLHTTTLLGVADDILDLRWRHKVLIPALASLPLLLVYYVDFGVTSIVVPRFLLRYIPTTSITNPESGLIHLGPLYYAYMAALSIFAPNSINILAGINGIEVGQSIVVALLLMLNSSLYLIPFPGNPILGSSPPARAFPHPATDSHLFTLYLLLPFLAVSMALYTHNRYPARAFVGDTYCYFAGMVFAVVGILGHFSKTLLLLLIPQIFNFLYSSPQLFGLVPCPRHRLPKYNARTNLLEPSITEYPAERPPSKFQTMAFFALAKMHFLEIEVDPDTNRIQSSTNLTILNLWLVWFGPMREDRLAYGLLAMQSAFGLFGLFVRHRMALWIFSLDNRGYGGGMSIAV